MATAPIETRILATPNIPTSNVSVGLPTDIFSFDIMPKNSQPRAIARGSVAYLSEYREVDFQANEGAKAATLFSSLLNSLE